MDLVLWLRNYLRRDLWLSHPGRAPLARAADRLARIAVTVVWAAWDGQLNLRAMSLVYTTLLSLVPMIAVTFSVLKAFGAQYRIQPLLVRGLAPLGDTSGVIAARLVEFVNNLQVGVLGALGLAGLFFTVVSLLGKIEEALNAIWLVRRSRGFARKFSDYLSIVLVGPVLVFTALAILASAQSYWLVRWLMDIAPVQWVVLFAASQVMPLILFAAAFTFLYRFVPHTRVPLGSALVGGSVAAVLWHLAGLAFARFVATSAQYAAIYSGFAILVVFLIWIYVGWLVVLIGAQVAYAHQYPTAYLESRRPHGFARRERIALGLLAEVTRRHLAHRPPCRLNQLAAALDAPLSTVDELVDTFVRRGILLRASEPEGIALARPPESVALVETLDAVRDPTGADLGSLDAGGDPAVAVLRRRDAGVHHALAGLTLHALAADPAPVEAVGRLRAG
jgi:membrane protein